ncbi:conserved membrane protein of unknown function [Petrocella atlantisensis]|uniref:DUF4386 domain-containing protein n=1 Tax=Petrocella atlantisensis TaxID=2173034 RepID=A0A3P7PSP9_9FIRM|nr:DUF4386 domain-containing protein [Petrocella atlantisensis]VDN47097.1 conserved membrane protein of unknown function [Petrocella atlantisensis]
MKTSNNNPIRFWSITSGISLLIMAIAAGYAYGFSFNQIYVENNTLQTMTNIQSNSTLFYSGAIVWCLILATDIIVSYGFYRFLKPIHKPIALISGCLRLTYSVFLAIGIAFLFGKNTEQFLKMWSLGLFIIGFHLVITGIGAFLSTETPKLFGVLLIIAGISYSLIHGLQNFVPQAISLAAYIESFLTIPMTVGELSFGIWLLIKGGRKINQQPSNDPVPDAS